MGSWGRRGRGRRGGGGRGRGRGCEKYMYIFFAFAIIKFLRKGRMKEKSRKIKGLT